MNTKRVFLTSLFSIALITVINAQKLNPVNLNVRLGAGLLSTYFMDGGETSMPPAFVNVDYRLTNLFSIGAYGAYSSSESRIKIMEDGSAHQWSNTTTSFGVRATAHAPIDERFSFYGGVQLGYFLPNVEHHVLIPGESFLPQSTVQNTFSYTGFIGLSGYLTKNLGIFGELGYDISLVKVGVTAHL